MQGEKILIIYKITEMKLIKKTLFILMLSLAYTSQTKAQMFDDWEARPNISLKYKFNKKWSVTGTYYFYLDKNMSQYDKSVIAGEVDYKVNSWLKAGIDYRYGISEKKRYHDLRYSVTFDYNPSKKWKIEYRPMVQQKFTSLQKSHLALKPIKYYIRNRLTASYDVSSAIKVFVFTENYLRPKQGDINFHRQKSALGAEFEIGNRSEIGTRFEVINKKSGKMYARPNLNFTYTLGYVKNKK